MSIVLPQGFEYITLPLVGLAWVLTWQGILVSVSRRKAGIAYPQMYAEQAECKSNPVALQFNCMQRAHQNTLENTPVAVLGIIVTGLRHPCLAAALGGGFVVGRIIYTLGYKTGDPSKRAPGFWIGNLSSIGLLTVGAHAALKLSNLL